MKEILLITGANGFIGKHLCANLKNKYNIHQIVSPRHRDNLDNYVFSCDLSNHQETERLINKLPLKNYKAVIHLAALLSKPGDWNNINYFDANNKITNNMISLVKNVNCNSFINFSSLAVYPNRDGFYDEESIVEMADNTECLYGLAKFNAEILFKFYLKKLTKVINLRLAQSYGHGMQNDRLIGVFRNELVKTNSITLYGNGMRVSNFVHVNDIIESIHAVLINPMPGTFNLGNDKNVSYMSIAERIIAAIGNDGSKIIKKNEGVKAKVAIDTKKFEQQFGRKSEKNDFSFLKE
jgi:UDP-glucose 4-epimerase